MVLTRERAEARVQELLAIAKTAIDEVTVLAKKFELEPSFMEMTFRCRLSSYRLMEPRWFSDEYWESSTAGCEVGYYYPGEEP